MYNKACTLYLLLFVNTAIFGQTTLSGKVTDTKGQPLFGAAIVIAGTQVGTTTDANGLFSITPIPTGDLRIRASYLGYQQEQITLHVEANESHEVSFKLHESDEALNEVIVTGKSEAQIKREAPIKAEVIDFNKMEARSISLPQAINQVAGVKVRQNGGMGSGTTININGLQGKAIRFFRDGIPMDYLGKAFNLSILPVDQLSNIQIYKGVLPADLGTDALGGAVNFISQAQYDTGLDVSYSMGSFNTHQATINGYWNIPNAKVFATLSSYYIYSDNDYKINVDIADEDTGVLKEEEVKRFHDGIQTAFAEGKIGLKNTKAADLLEVGIAWFDWEKELQNSITLTDAYGEAMNTEEAIIATARYQKAFDKLSIDLFGAYSDRNTLFDDTPENRYDWHGVATPIADNDNGGETDLTVQSYRSLNFDTWTARLNLHYQLTPHHELSFNHNYIYEHRLGSDPYGELYNNEKDVLTYPAKYTRHISALGLTSSFLGGKIKNIITAKRYGVITSSVTSNAEFYGEVPEFSDESYGIGEAIKYNFSDHSFIRLSYERATRIPETEEYFGDAVFITGNPELNPELSHNVNFGVYTSLKKDHTLWLDVNTFYRYVENNIFLRPYYLIMYRYENTDDSQVMGAEMTLKGHTMDRKLQFNVAVTYQDIRRKSTDITSQLLEDARQPNIPYFFSNLNLTFRPDHVVGKGQWSFYANYSYVEKYLLNAIPKAQEPALFGSTKNISGANIIPTQNLVDIGFTYRMSALPLRINGELNNLLDAEAYDGFRVQKPGINYRIKLKYSINKGHK